jgi:hypothetical protein
VVAAKLHDVADILRVFFADFSEGFGAYLVKLAAKRFDFFVCEFSAFRF